MWLSGIGVSERIVTVSEYVELPDGKVISVTGLFELAFCGWQQASEL